MTSRLFSLLAAQDGAPALPSTLNTNAQHSLRGVAPILLAITVVLLGFIFWAVFIRKSPKYRRKGVLIDVPAEEGSGRRRHRRRSRREHRPRNPTRAETGGLPPPGAGNSEPPLL